MQSIPAICHCCTQRRTVETGTDNSRAISDTRTPCAFMSRAVAAVALALRVRGQ